MDNRYTETESTEEYETLQESSIESSNKDASSLVSPGEIIIGQLIDFNESGQPLIIYPGSKNDGLAAISTVAINHEHKGRQLALLFAEGDLSKPVIMGLIYNPLLDILNNVEFVAESPDDNRVSPEQKSKSSQLQAQNSKNSTDTAYIDGNRVVLEGKEEIVLKCGDASITLTKEGKILIRGKYLLNRSSGINRIMGGSVQVN